MFFLSVRPPPPFFKFTSELTCITPAESQTELRSAEGSIGPLPLGPAPCVPDVCGLLRSSAMEWRLVEPVFCVALAMPRLQAAIEGGLEKRPRII